MQNQYHILNGDCLKDQFPKELEGERIVARECLVDGAVNGETLEELLEVRAKFISNQYAVFSEEDYYEGTAVEFKKMLAIPSNADVNLWFEDDLFCQVNFWFALNLLFVYGKKKGIYLIRPNKGNEYSFGIMNQKELLVAFENRIEIEGELLEKMSQLWRLYQKEDWMKMERIASDLQSDFPFVLEAVNAQIDRLPSENSMGRPKETLKRITEDLQTSEFGPVFKEFCKRESIYGFGDLQVQVLLRELLADK